MFFDIFQSSTCSYLLPDQISHAHRQFYHLGTYLHTVLTQTRYVTVPLPTVERPQPSVRIYQARRPVFASPAVSTLFMDVEDPVDTAPPFPQNGPNRSMGKSFAYQESTTTTSGYPLTITTEICTVSKKGRR